MEKLRTNISQTAQNFSQMPLKNMVYDKALTFQNNVTLNGSGSIVNLTPTGSGYVTINPGAAGTINNMSVGQTTPLNGKFTPTATFGFKSIGFIC
jgi:hypothetical protein